MIQSLGDTVSDIAGSLQAGQTVVIQRRIGGRLVDIAITVPE